VTALDELRREIAAQHGIPESAAVLISGETVEAIEESAAKLAALIDTSREQEPEQQENPLTDALRHGSSLKLARQRALVAALHPRQQRRDEQGRFARTGEQAAGFDGGARPPVAESRPPAVEHDRLVAEMAQLSRTFGARISV
jgi:hypothetical protein